MKGVTFSPVSYTGLSRNKLIVILKLRIFVLIHTAGAKTARRRKQKSHTATSYGYRLYPEEKFKWIVIFSLVGGLEVWERNCATKTSNSSLWFEKLHSALAVPFKGCYARLLRMRDIKLSWPDTSWPKIYAACFQMKYHARREKWNWPKLFDILEFQGCLRFDLQAKTLFGNANWVLLFLPRHRWRRLVYWRREIETLENYISSELMRIFPR